MTTSGTLWPAPYQMISCTFSLCDSASRGVHLTTITMTSRSTGARWQSLWVPSKSRPMRCCTSCGTTVEAMRGRPDDAGRPRWPQPTCSVAATQLISQKIPSHSGALTPRPTMMPRVSAAGAAMALGASTGVGTCIAQGSSTVVTVLPPSEESSLRPRTEYNVSLLQQVMGQTRPGATNPWASVVFLGL